MKREMEGAMAKALRATGAAHKTGPCDVCGGEKARWYCAADEARLCDACDATVHSANAVARRHERVSMSTSIGFAFPRRARSSRGAARTSADKKGLAKEKLRHAKIHVTVPGSDDCASRDDEIEAEDEEELVPEVPTVKAEPPDVDSTSDLNAIFTVDEFPDDIDVDSIMGVGHGFGGDGAAPAQHVHVKREGDDHECDWDTIEFNIVCGQVEGEIDDQKMMRMALDLDSDLGSMLPAPHNHSAKKLSLQLDYDDVLSAWSDRGSLWASPEDDRCSLGGSQEMAGTTAENTAGRCWVADGEYRQQRDGREARVLRYREKRRTRLFSKKIRYEVRKLNAEKRPRMKGRFVKRSSCGE